MKHKNFLYNFLSILYLEFLFSFLTFDVYNKSSIINIFIFSLIISSIITMINNKIASYIIYSILGFYFSMQFILKKVFGFYFSFNLLKLTDQVLKFGGTTIISILKNIYAIILFFLPHLTQVSKLILIPKYFKYLSSKILHRTKGSNPFSNLSKVLKKIFKILLLSSCLAT